MPDHFAKRFSADAGGYRAKGELFGDLARQIPWLNPRTPEQVESLWRERFPGCIAIRDGAHEVLTLLRRSGLRLGIVTNGRQDMQSAKIDAMGLGPAVDCAVISGAVGVKKPDPRIYKLALESLGVAASETLFVGDHFQLDVDAPRSLGMKTAWLRLGRGWRDDSPPPDYSINALSDLIPLPTNAP